MKVRCLLIGVVVLFVTGVLTASSYAKIDLKTAAGIWLFDEGKGDTAKDSSGNQNDGKLVGSPKWVDGQFGKGLEFDGLNNYVNVEYNSVFDMTKGLTIAAWIKRTSATNYGHPVLRPTTDSGWTNPYISYALEYEALSDTIMLCLGYADDTYNYTKGAAPGNNVWFHVVGTYDGVNRKMYINGTQEQSESETRALKSTKAKLYMGAENTSKAYPFKGTIDEVAVFNVALNESDINTVMTQGWAAIAAVFPSGKLTTTWAAIKAR
jgi:hypothetical protein